MMALIIGSSVAMVETTGFKLVGCLVRDDIPRDVVFSPDASSLAIYHPFNIDIIDLSTGEISKSFAVGESNQNLKLRWVGKNLLVGEVLYDPGRGVPVWTYKSRSAATATLGNYLISGFGGDNGSTLGVFKLPHDEAVRAAADIDPEKIYSIVPGDAITVEYNLGSLSPAVTQAILRGGGRKNCQPRLEALAFSTQ